MAESMEDAVCAGCAKPLGVRANWRVVRGRAYHNDCEPMPEPEPPPPPEVESLPKRVERAARTVKYGRGQRTLEEDTDD